MSSTGNQKRTLVAAVRHIWQLGGVRYFYRGLTVRHYSLHFVNTVTQRLLQIGLVGVFP